jgi:hypothetical protein
VNSWFDDAECELSPLFLASTEEPPAGHRRDAGPLQIDVLPALETHLTRLVADAENRGAVRTAAPRAGRQKLLSVRINYCLSYIEDETQNTY